MSGEVFRPKQIIVLWEGVLPFLPLSVFGSLLMGKYTPKIFFAH